jgi:hypothetical protein
MSRGRGTLLKRKSDPVLPFVPIKTEDQLDLQLSIECATGFHPVSNQTVILTNCQSPGTGRNDR